VISILTVAAPAAYAATIPVLSVDSSGHVTNNGTVWQLRGVDKSGSEYACVQNFGIMTGDSTQSGIDAMLAWHINAVRLPLNEDCWLGINGVNSKYAGANYQTAITNYVNQLASNGMVAVLDLHWSAPGTELATKQQPMADADHSITFWKSVASAYKTHTSVIFDLFNEPYASSGDLTWACWKSGGCRVKDSISGGTYTAAGMDQLISAVRSTGATNPVETNGLQWGNDLSGWLANKPSDPKGRLIAGAHVYDINACVTAVCWNKNYKPILATNPIVISEYGSLSACTSTAQTGTGGILPWADSLAKKVSYLAWSWNASSCTAPSLVTNTSTGTPTNSYGVGIRAYYQSKAALPAN
jgi:hypothetical protein